jgi:L,D-peptidoglycan transpeptidase YkuD (ErfK/YbiS/YcfS/YnhG family)
VLTPTGLRIGNHRHPCTIGRNGVTADKREGDGATPRGALTVTGLLYRPDRIARPVPWARAIRPGDLWSDDPADPLYNRMVRAPRAFSHESLRRADPLYDLVILTDWNAGGVPGRGSAIFLHQWRRPGFPTAGCIALPRGVLHRLARHLSPGSRIVVR